MRNKLLRVFLKVILALFIFTGIIFVGSIFIWAIAENSPNITIGQVWGILGLLIIGTIYIAYLLCFSKWANKNIWMRYENKPNIRVQTKSRMKKWLFEKGNWELVWAPVILIGFVVVGLFVDESMQKKYSYTLAIAGWFIYILIDLLIAPKFRDKK
tara:strand:- start:67 stop:534 length:468 start_codon:yes stop_codon:yes gene_type:complete